MAKKDIVVIGASAGGVEALSALVAALPPDFDASVFVVVHTPPDATSLLPQILTRRGKLPATHPRDGEAIKKARIYVAPPNQHLLLEKGRIRVISGPRENGVRPAIDPLFRSAAHVYGERVIGVVLSGNLDDGTAGIASIKLEGGTTIAQDPAEALYPGMVMSAVRSGSVDYCLPIAQLGEKLGDLLHNGVRPGAPMTGSNREERAEEKELAIEKLDFGQLHSDDQPGTVSTLTCPECNGALWEIATRDTLRYRCRVGHAFAVESLLSEQRDAIEAAFWMALRALEERGVFLRRLVDRAEKSGSNESRKRYTEEEKLVAARAKTLRDIILSGIVTNAVSAEP